MKLLVVQLAVAVGVASQLIVSVKGEEILLSVSLRQVRPANVTDILRGIACFFIVFYHIQYYWSLEALTPKVDTLKLFFLTWAMPFFYVTSTRFAIVKVTPSKLLSRIGSILLLLIAWSCLYTVTDIFLLLLKCLWKGLPFDLSDAFFSKHSVLEVIRLCGYSPGYFLYDLVVVAVFSCIFNVVHKQTQCFKAVFFILFWSVFFCLYSCFVSAFGNFIPKVTVFVCICSANAYVYFGEYVKLLGRKIGCNRLLTISLVMFTFPAAFFSWQFIICIFSFVFLLLHDLVDVSGEAAFLATLSSAGQRLSMGVFLLHQAVLNFADLFFVKIYSCFFPPGPSALLWLVIGLTGFYGALRLTTYFLAQPRLRWLVSM